MKLICLLAAGIFAAVAYSSSAQNAQTSDAEAKYTRAIEGRAAEVVKVLALADTNQTARVHATIVSQYRALRAWHDEFDPQLKAAKGDTHATATIKASLNKLHAEFLARLAADLTPAQIEQVKDKMTYGKVQFTFKGYLVEYPDLTEAQKAEVLRLLQEAREEAMDGGSSEEKSAIFNRYKGKINNYLSKQGVVPARKKAAASAVTNVPAK